MTIAQKIRKLSKSKNINQTATLKAVTIKHLNTWDTQYIFKDKSRLTIKATKADNAIPC